MIKQRNAKIFEMRDKGATLEQISKKFKLSGERIRQIVLEPNFCVRHSKMFEKECKYCLIEDKYKEELNKLILGRYLSVGAELGLIRHRQALEISKKRAWVRIGRDKFKFSFDYLGRILKRDHTSIMNLYYNN